MDFYINGVGVAGSGMTNWQESSAVLTGKKLYVPSEPEYVEPDILPANERRRSVKTVQLAIQVAMEAVENSRAKMESLQTVFASSMGDGFVMDSLFKSLAMPNKVVSPITFHNSVHNAAAGYWLIGAGCMKASTSIACKETTFGSALMESTSQLIMEAEEIQLVAYDIPSPKPLQYAMSTNAVFAVSFILSRTRRERSLALVELSTTPKDGNQPSGMDDVDLEALRIGNPAARSLPILFSLANGNNRDILIEYTKQAFLRLNVKPCG
ncbi:3-oxoacyl-[ACP] synthase [hydrothermal vent metagenome]|uniref:3-oxoacyl-[ACP] synthase n=1 Tax=hydrothermal vent metagenome TaxID=652676 RepID=A0A3B1BKV8_9ZZZZ